MLCCTFWGASSIGARVILSSLRSHSVPVKILLWNRNNQLRSEAARPPLKAALTAKLCHLFNVFTIPLSVLCSSGSVQLLGKTEDLRVWMHFFIVSPKYTDHRMRDIYIPMPFKLLPRKYNFPFVTVLEGQLHLTCSPSGFPFSATLSTALLYARWLLVAKVCKNFPYLCITSSQRSSCVSCCVLDALRIHTRDLLTAETSQYSAGTEHLGVPKHLILNVILSYGICSWKICNIGL